MPETNRQIVLVSRPQGAPTTDNFALREAPLAPLGDGQVRVRGQFLSLDPYMRGRMSEAQSYAPPQPLGEVMGGGGVGSVIESRNPAWTIGDKVVGMIGWQEFATLDGAGLMQVDDSRIPLSAYLGAVGMPGVTAWYGLNRICQPKSGETVAVSAASGAVGSVVGQLARRLGCRVVGIAGGPAKCAYVTGTLGFDACVDYKGGAMQADLEAAAPGGIDAYFDNVGGAVLDAVLARMNDFGRIAICGAIAGYNGEPQPLRQPARILRSRLLVQGFIVSDHMQDWPVALHELGGLVADGRLVFRESVAEGLASAPAAFVGMLRGENFGKQLVRLA